MHILQPVLKSFNLPWFETNAFFVSRYNLNLFTVLYTYTHVAVFVYRTK